MSVEQFTNEIKALEDAYNNHDANAIDQGNANLESMIDQSRPSEHISVEETNGTQQSTSSS